MPIVKDIASLEQKISAVGGAALPPTDGPGGNGGHPSQPQKLPLGVYRVAMLAGLAAILMMFAGLISAFIVRGMSWGWHDFALPRTLWLSTALLLASSFALQKARQAVRADDNANYQRWLKYTTALGCGFVLTQLASWIALVQQGVYLQGNPHSAFFYLFTGLHGVHILGGLIALAWLVANARRGVPSDEYQAQKRVVLADTVALYWHFMDGLWICLFVLLLVK